MGEEETTTESTTETTEPTTEPVEETTEPDGGESADTGETTVETPTEETTTEGTTGTAETVVSDELATTEEVPADSVTVAYKPVFNTTVRTAIYVVCLLASVIGLGFMCFGYADVGGYISTAAGVIASGFGVAYNPIRTSN